MKKNYLADFVKRNKIFLTILALALAVRIILSLNFHQVWWDSGVYMGMGKHLFSLGQIGLWEHIRPILWPFILGVGWKSGLNMIIFGKVLEIILSIASIYLVYLITLQVFNKKTAIIASAMFSFSTIFLYLGFHLYTEIPALFFILLGIYLFIVKKYYFAGLSFGFAFLTKFPTPIFFIGALLILLYKKQIKNSLFICLGFATPVIPFLIANQIFYGNFLLPLTNARIAIQNVLGCNVLRYKPGYYYFYEAFIDNPLNIFSILGLFFFFRRHKKRISIISLSLLIPFIYFSQLHCRDHRYLALFIPFIIMFSAFGISKCFKKKKYLLPVVIIIIIISASFSIYFHFSNEQKKNEAAEGYFRFLENKQTGMEIWSSNPMAAVYSNLKINKIYYPVYNEEIAVSFNSYLKENHGKIGYVLMDNCGGGIICAQDDNICIENTDMTINFLDENFNIVYYEKRGRCFYKIYENPVIS